MVTGLKGVDQGSSGEKKPSASSRNNIHIIIRVKNGEKIYKWLHRASSYKGNPNFHESTLPKPAAPDQTPPFDVSGGDSPYEWNTEEPSTLRSAAFAARKEKTTQQ